MLQLPLPSVVTITANQHFAVNRWNPNYSGTHNKQAAGAATEKPGASAEKPGGGGEAAGASKGEGQRIFLSSSSPLCLTRAGLA